MSKSKGIEVWVRVRPTKKPDNQMSMTPEDGKIELNFTKDGLRNLETRKEHFEF